jgi:hypothetical protein
MSTSICEKKKSSFKKKCYCHYKILLTWATATTCNVWMRVEGRGGLGDDYVQKQNEKENNMNGNPWSLSYSELRVIITGCYGYKVSFSIASRVLMVWVS